MGEYAEAAVSGAAKGIAPYAALGVIILAAAGILQHKYDITGRAEDAKAAVDAAIRENYTEEVLHVDDKQTQNLIAEGTLTFIPPEDYEKVYQDLGSSDINIMTEEEFKLFAADPTAYMNAYAKKEGWF